MEILGRNHPNKVFKVNIVGNGKNQEQNPAPPEMCNEKSIASLLWYSYQGCKT